MTFKAVGMFGDRIDADVLIGRIAVKPFDALVLEDVVVTDRNPYADGTSDKVDTLLSVGNLSARFSLKGLLHKERISVSRLRLENGTFNLVMEPGENGASTTNLQRILHLKDLLEQLNPERLGFSFLVTPSFPFSDEVPCRLLLR